MKIGILTFQNTTNYGALLQAFAMQRTFKKLGVECELIDYECDNIIKREMPTSLFAFGIEHVPAAFLNRCIQQKKYKQLERFKARNCKLSNCKYTKHNIEDASKVYDKFISGSDIIWEMNVTGQDTTYFLDFIHDSEKKYALSSSFGYTSIPEEYQDICRGLLRNYKEISVREEESLQIIEELIGKKPLITVDPTLFMTSEEWKDYEKPVPIKGKYVLVYFDDKEHKILSFAKKIAQKYNCEVIYVAEKVRETPGARTIRAASVGEFLWLIEHAEFVVTASFHGVAYSINFNTDFYYLNRIHQGRINTLMHLLGIEDRSIDSSSSESLDWNQINLKLQVLRNQSLEYIKRIINE